VNVEPVGAVRRARGGTGGSIFDVPRVSWGMRRQVRILKPRTRIGRTDEFIGND